MTTLDRILQMQNEGRPETEIITQLQNEGIAPKEIQDALGQAKIKNAVSPPETPQQQPQAQPQEVQSVTIPDPNAAPQQEYQQEPPQETYQQPQAQEQYYTQQPQAYSGEDYYPQSNNYEADTISEIAEQVATEKLETYKSKVGDVASFKNQIQNKVEDIDDRLKRIESSIDRLQQAILGKIGEFGESSAAIHKDLDNLHGTVSKLMDPLIDNINEMQKINKK